MNDRHRGGKGQTGASNPLRGFQTSGSCVGAEATRISPVGYAVAFRHGYQRVQCGMHDGGTGVHFDRDAGVGKEVRLAEFDKPAVNLAGAGGAKIAHGIFKDVGGGREADPSQCRGDNSVLGGTSRIQRFCHCPALSALP